MIERILRSCACAAALSAAGADAQVAPDIEQSGGDVIRQVAPRPPDAERAPLDADAGLAPASGPRSLSPEAAALGVFVAWVSVEGSARFDAAALAPVLEGFAGTERSLAEIAALADRIEAFIRSEGFVFTRVTPPDAIAEGAVVFRIVEARIETVTVEESAGPVGPALSLLAGIARTLEGLENPHIEALERVLLLMRDVPGITRATAAPSRAPGGAPGALALAINVERAPVSGAIFGDTRQSPSVGDGLIGATVSFNSFGPGGDTLQVTAINSIWTSLDDLDERHLGQVEYSRALGRTGLVVDARALLSVAKPGANLAPIDIDSDQYEFEVALEYPIVRTRALSVWARGALILLETESAAGEAPISDDSVRTAEISLRALRRDAGGYTAATLGARIGLDLFDATDSGDAGRSRSDGTPDAAVVFAELEREQRIAEGLTAWLRFGGQIATDALLASEEFSIGGTTFGRGYDSSEFLGDDGFGVSAELRYDVALDAPGLSLAGTGIGPLQLYAFGDYGWIRNRDTGSDDIYSAGAGARLDLPQAVSLTFEVAKPLTDLQRTSDDNVRVFFGFQKLS